MPYLFDNNCVVANKRGYVSSDALAESAECFIDQLKTLAKESSNMTYDEAYKLATWICLNCAMDCIYVSHRFNLDAFDVLQVVRCVSKDCQQIDIAKLKRYFPTNENPKNS